MLATMTMHVDQLDVPIATVRRLIAEQFPQWTHLPVRAVASSGTVNALFRIGDHLTARFPLQLIEVAAAREWLEEEAEAARELAGRTAYATPEPVATGEPGAGYPLPWSVQTWVPGTPAAEDDTSDSMAFAHDLAAFVRGVRSIDTRGRTFARAGRGGDLRTHDAWMRHGTCWSQPPERSCARIWAATTSSGLAVRPGPSSRQWALSGTTWTPTRRCTGWVKPLCNAFSTHKV